MPALVIYEFHKQHVKKNRSNGEVCSSFSIVVISLLEEGACLCASRAFVCLSECQHNGDYFALLVPKCLKGIQ